MVNSLYGMKIIVNPHGDKFEWFQSIFPRSRKKRITKKFAKDMDNYSKRLLDEMLLFGDTLVVGPMTMEKMKAAVNIAEGSQP